MSSITFLDILGIIGGLIFGAAAFVYMFRYMPRVEEMTDLRNDNRRLEKENQELREAASTAATERCEDAGLYDGKMMEMQRALLKQQQRSDEREAAHLREIERQREFIETISQLFDKQKDNIIPLDRINKPYGMEVKYGK